MRKLIYLVAATLDGFIAASAGSDPSGTVFELEGDHASSLLDEYPETIPFHVRPMIGMGDVEPRHFDTVLEGRASYEIGRSQGVSDAYPHLRHLVFSSTLDATPAESIELVTSDAIAHVRALKAEQGRDIWLCGGGSLAASLRTEIDEIHLKLHPVVLGTGIPLLAPPTTPEVDRFRLRSAQPFQSGVSLMIYERR
ncbi:dihydrofolate reductase family protein [Gordonia sp. PKS22-38]|uniref:Dihydrofolate reductase family protein n=1 Tax=Gordonia prachuapensis TaxID=3115651 RepID=A0ABU7MX72_9ACTN|nr:dihydrofolate reductase family protein [Gordonia sp. PKS22-38]